MLLETRIPMVRDVIPRARRDVSITFFRLCELLFVLVLLAVLALLLLPTFSLALG